MNAILLYTRYAVRSFVRDRKRSVFAAFCVAVGITSVVALSLTAGNFRNALTADARKSNRGDVSVTPAGYGLTLQQYRLFAQLKATGKIVDYTNRFQDDAILRSGSRPGGGAVGQFYAVDPAKFPFYDRITAKQPAGIPLKALLAARNSAVVSSDVLATLHLRVGDRVHVDSRRGFGRTYTITGVVPDNAPDASYAFGAGLFDDFALVNESSTLPFFHGLNDAASVVYIKTRDAAAAVRVKRYLLDHLSGLPSVKTVADVERDQANSAKGFNTFFRIMSLIAVVIGGVGIVNTMLVAARRRTLEIAVLKTLGMKGRQVIVVFIIEALLLALAGSVIGLLGGIGASYAVNSVTQSLAGYAIPWTLQATPLLSGIAVGIVGTLLFAYLPTVKASRARPVEALRSSLGPTYRRGLFRRVFGALCHPVTTVRRTPTAIAGFPKNPVARTGVLVIGLAALGGILAVRYADLAIGGQGLIVGVAAGIGALVVAGVLTQIFVAVIWLVSKLPSLGVLSARMAFRSMGTQRRRLGSTMLALCVGMLMIGSVAILAQNLKASASQALVHQLGVNVAIQTPYNPAAKRRVDRTVAGLPGVTRRIVGLVANGATLTTVDGRSAAAILNRKVAAGRLGRGSLTNIAAEMRGLEAQPSSQPYALRIAKGRGLNAHDTGTDHIVIPDDVAQALNIHLGSRVTFRDGRSTIPFTIVGTFSGGFTIFNNVYVDSAYAHRMGLDSPGPSHLRLVYLDVTNAQRAGDLARLRSSNPDAVVLNLGDFVGAVNRLVDKLVLFPEIIALLALFAGVVIIANTVALSMLERRREIGVMKAVGAKRAVILRFLFVEHAIVGLLGAGAGIALSMVVTAAVDSSLLQIEASFDWVTIAGLLLVGVALTVGASAITALPASSEKPLTILRYE